MVRLLAVSHWDASHGQPSSGECTHQLWRHQLWPHKGLALLASCTPVRALGLAWLVSSPVATAQAPPWSPAGQLACLCKHTYT